MYVHDYQQYFYIRYMSNDTRCIIMFNLNISPLFICMYNTYNKGQAYNTLQDNSSYLGTFISPIKLYLPLIKTKETVYKILNIWRIGKFLVPLQTVKGFLTNISPVMILRFKKSLRFILFPSLFFKQLDLLARICLDIYLSIYLSI